MIPHNRPWITSGDKKAVNDVLSTKYLSKGRLVNFLENKFSQFYNSGYACATSSGTTALTLLLKSLNLKKNAKIALPTYACSALLNAVFSANATPVLVDIEDNTYGIDINKLSKKVDAVIIVHTFGEYININKFKTINTKIIEDCCHSLGGEHNNKKIGKEGDASIFSFYATKIITGGEGGLIWSKNKNLIDKALDYRNFDLKKKYYPRTNFNLTDLQASLILNQFKRINLIRKKRSNLAKKFFLHLNDDIKLQPSILQKNRMAYRFVMHFPSKKIRDNFKKHMLRNRVKCIVPIERFELLHRYLKLNPKNFVVSEKIVDTTLSIPNFPDLTKLEENKICKALKSFNY